MVGDIQGTDTSIFMDRNIEKLDRASSPNGRNTWSMRSSSQKLSISCDWSSTLVGEDWFRAFACQWPVDYGETKSDLNVRSFIISKIYKSTNYTTYKQLWTKKFFIIFTRLERMFFTWLHNHYDTKQMSFLH